jgi:hypothetical protein
MTKKGERRRSDFMRNNLIQMNFAVVRALLDRVEQFKDQLFILCKALVKREAEYNKFNDKHSRAHP